MKKLISLLIVNFIVLTLAFGQANFEGVVSFKVDYTNIPEELQSMQAMLPKDLTMKIKGNKRKVEQQSVMGKTILILDDDKKNSISLIDIQGEKVAIELSEKQMEIEKSKSGNDAPPQIDYFDENKEIAGMICFKAHITMEGEDQPVSIYYTKEIQSHEIGASYEGLEGFPMQYEVTNQGMTMLMTATKVTETTIDKNEFVIPEGFTKMTTEEFQKKFMPSAE